MPVAHVQDNSIHIHHVVRGGGGEQGVSRGHVAVSDHVMTLKSNFDKTKKIHKQRNIATHERSGAVIPLDRQSEVGRGFDFDFHFDTKSKKLSNRDVNQPSMIRA